MIVDLSTDQCTNPGPGAAGAGGTGIARARNIGAGTSGAYCFVVRERLGVFNRPDGNAATIAFFNPTDIAYATANPARTVVTGGRSFVEVAIYNGNRGWLPRTSRAGGAPVIVDLSADQCTNPGPGAAGFGGSGIARTRGMGAGTSGAYCFVVRERLGVLNRPDGNAATVAFFNPTDIAYATANPPRTVVSGGRSFVEVAIYNGNRGWLPRTSRVNGGPVIVDLSADQCTNPGPGAAGRR
ncbi:MAG: hypothetical protein HC929_24340 [Leptolyngbyaceae cyanobacterium SM2_5_2]|nr:hypothetical protein [Leptolyngbyaceae cyanobacterium SM2_5_2]